jgi:hypothetical protein
MDFFNFDAFTGLPDLSQPIASASASSTSAPPTTADDFSYSQPPPFHVGKVPVPVLFASLTAYGYVIAVLILLVSR